MVDLDSAATQGNPCAHIQEHDETGTAPLMLRCLLACVVAGQLRGTMPAHRPRKRPIASSRPPRRDSRPWAHKASRTGWVQNNFITVDTQKIAADAQSDLAAAVTELARGARRFEALPLPDEDARKLKLLKLHALGAGAGQPGRAR